MAAPARNKMKKQESQRGHSNSTDANTDLWTHGLICAFEFVRRHKKVLATPQFVNHVAKKQVSSPELSNSLHSRENRNNSCECKDDQEDNNHSPDSHSGHFRGKEGLPRNCWVPIGWDRISELVQTVQVDACWEQPTDFKEDDNDVAVADVAAPYWERPVGPTWWCHVAAGHPYINSWLRTAQWLHPAVSIALRDESKLISERMKHILYKYTTPHVVMVPSPGMGHLIPLVELAKLFVHHHNFTVTFIIPTIGSHLPKPQISILQSLPPQSTTYFFLPPISFDYLPQETKAETKITLAVTRSISSIRDVFQSLAENANLVALVVDIFGTDAFDVAHQFNVPPYLYFPSMTMGLILLLYMPKLDSLVSSEYRDLAEPVKLPGCTPICGRDFPEPFQDRRDEAYKLFLHHGKRVGLAEGIILNSFMELEPDPIKALQDDTELCRPPVYPIGPLIQTGSCGWAEPAGGLEYLRWLDDQPTGSVLFVSFGSGGTLSSEQLTELALGLEMSGTKFLWVVRSPNNKASNASFFSVHSQTDPLGCLPYGFVERTKRQGLSVPSWAPQTEVLGHGSVGGFLSHCGWNSILESIVNGVPLIAWPLYAEQKMNAIVLTEVLKVALRPKADENGIVGREEIARVVKELMEGEEGFRVRDQMNYWKEAAVKAKSEEGSSTKSLSELVIKWKKHKK